uniref:Uncharacterized protein n=1 Tax=Morchella brunnea TaxID=1174671 RepID=A0A8K1I7R5_9PEZI|nr:hypothetical protein LK370_mgp026 [Morchella brunnea]UBU98458.1 hypothetical protein [Morchella brunnea]
MHPPPPLSLWESGGGGSSRGGAPRFPFRIRGAPPRERPKKRERPNETLPTVYFLMEINERGGGRGVFLACAREGKKKIGGRKGPLGFLIMAGSAGQAVVLL